MAKKFKVHPMFKDCKTKMAFTEADHEKLSKQGYNHTKDPSCDKKKKKKK
tara:strand:- start:1625 stop:1774 length:150 start_codon:yes stop_codon:yes gene_type:complete